MREIVACDVSKYQPPVDDRYPHKWLIFRCCDGGYHDPRCEQNRYWAQHAYAEGRLLGWTAYVVYRPGLVDATIEHAAMLPKAGAHLMVDAESWAGRIRGDHSTELNRLAAGLQRLFPGQVIPGLPRVWGYGNQSDLRGIWPHRSVPVVVAAYSSTKPSVPGMIGWQYTDGTTRNPIPAGKPRSTPPFGPCDHNILYLPDPRPAKEDDDMGSIDHVSEEAADTFAAALLGKGLAGATGGGVPGRGYNGNLAEVLVSINAGLIDLNTNVKALLAKKAGA